MEDWLRVGYFCGTGISGGRIFLRAAEALKDISEQVVVQKATQEDIAGIKKGFERILTRFDSRRNQG